MDIALKTVLVTCTFYKSKSETRFLIALRTITKAIEAGYKIVVIDDSPDETIGDDFRRLGANVLRQNEKGMGPSRRQGFSSALVLYPYHRVFVWIEPEKDDLVRSIKKIVTPIILGEADCVHAGRTDAAWKTYPEFQQGTEAEANRLFSEIVGFEADYFFGPIAFSRAMAIAITLLQPQMFGINDMYVQQYVSAWVRLHGARFDSVKVDFVYPPEQKLEEETTLSDEMRAKRISQRDSIIADLRTLKAALAKRIGN
jgi:hypothetical protein